MATDGAQVEIELHVGTDEEAAAFQNWLTENGEIDVQPVEQMGILPIIGVVLAGAIAAAAVAKLVRWWQISHGCEQILDFTSGKLVQTVNCEFKNGKVIVVAAKDQQVVISDVPDVLDLTDIAKTALTAGAPAAADAVNAAGGKATTAPAGTTATDSTGTPPAAGS